MPSADRAFRALAREQPETIVRLLEGAASALVTARGSIGPEDVDDPNLDPPPPVEADWVARYGERDVLHVECQGYRDDGFPDRLFRYHVALMLRYPRRRVHTVALWVIRPPQNQRIDEVVRDGVRVPVTPVVLSEVEADALLADPSTACFAAGARIGEGSSVDDVCRRIARALGKPGATLRERVMAVALAATAGRFDAMVDAMRQEKVEPVFIEDLVRFGEDRGVEKGRVEGREEGRVEGRQEGELEMARRALRVVCEARGWTLTENERARIEAESSIDELLEWQRRAVTATSIADVLT